MPPFYTGQIVQTKPEAGPVKVFKVLGHVLEFVEAEGEDGEVEYLTDGQLESKDDSHG